MTDPAGDREDSDLRSHLTRIVNGGRVLMNLRLGLDTPLMAGDTLRVGRDLR